MEISASNPLWSAERLLSNCTMPSLCVYRYCHGANTRCRSLLCLVSRRHIWLAWPLRGIIRSAIDDVRNNANVTYIFNSELYIFLE